MLGKQSVVWRPSDVQLQSRSMVAACPSGRLGVSVVKIGSGRNKNMFQPPAASLLGQTTNIWVDVDPAFIHPPIMNQGSLERRGAPSTEANMMLRAGR